MTDWQPQPLSSQRTLFPVPLQDMLEHVDISQAEMKRWHEEGLISFPPEEAGRYEPWAVAEVQFVAGIMRSGLCRPMIDQLLSRLSKPWRYDPHTTCYNFTSGEWRQLPAITEEAFREQCMEEVRENICMHLDSHLEQLAEDGDRAELMSILEEVTKALRRVEDEAT